MSDTVLAALVTTVGTVIVAALGVLAALVTRSNGHAKRAAAIAASAAKDAKAARVQVENDHTTNLREEADDRHSSTVVSFGRVLDAIDETRKDIGGLRGEVRAVRADVSTLYGRTDTNRERLDSLEDTIPKGHPAWASTNRPTPQTPGTDRSGHSGRDSPWT